ncbi:MAG: hypothetical protein WDZ27_02575 [Waddliaceae bacterium]
MTTQSPFEWQRHPKAEQLIMNALESACEQNSMIESLREDLLNFTSTRLFDWADHITLGYSPQLEQDLIEFGFEAVHASADYRVFAHPGAQLPRVVVYDHDEPVRGVAITVDSIADFLMVRGIHAIIEGIPYSGYRRSRVSDENGVELLIVERRGTQTLEPTYPDSDYVEKYLDALEKWQTRPRSLDDEDLAMEQTLTIAEDLVRTLGKDLAAWVVMEGERKYWQSRNFAAQLQKNRQDKLGMGWANHDHHTFRSSRRQFTHLIRLLEMLGFHCRERYYAGQQGGWGAQIMENSRCGLVCFCDLDLSPEEVEIDFAHHPLPELSKLATVGLWCELHGDSILNAGMHHLEAQFMFSELKDDLDHLGVAMMEPFSDFPYLKQAFTSGELWQVAPSRVNRLLQQGKITHQEADKFISYGAVGSHLENLQRREGYKGFNQKNVSYIIKKTDPRTLE